MVDTKDLKSFGLYRLCGFESHFLYKRTADSTAISRSSFSLSSMLVGLVVAPGAAVKDGAVGGHFPDSIEVEAAKGALFVEVALAYRRSTGPVFARTFQIIERAMVEERAAFMRPNRGIAVRHHTLIHHSIYVGKMIYASNDASRVMILLAGNSSKVMTVVDIALRTLFEITDYTADE